MNSIPLTISRCEQSMGFTWCSSYNERVSQLCDNFQDHLQEFQKDGHALVGMDSDFIDIMDTIVHSVHELEVYRSHAGFKTFDGYLTNCFHSILRQAMALDPVVYAIAVAARTDGLHELISYPFPPQWFHEGEAPPGIILPIDIEKHLAAAQPDCGVRMILHVDDENDKTFTMVGKGFNHQRLNEWRNDVVARGEGQWLDAPVHMEQIYSKADVKKYGKFVIARADRGNIRLLLPETPFGIPVGGTIDKTQRIVSPHYVAIRKDLSLERGGLGTYAEVCEANLNLLPVPKTPWGTHTGWQNQEKRFPAAVSMTGVWPLGDALLGATSWDNSGVIDNLQNLFGDNDARRKELVKEVRNAMRDRLIKRFESFIFLERRRFWTKSVYRNRAVYFGDILRQLRGWLLRRSTPPSQELDETPQGNIN